MLRKAGNVQQTPMWEMESLPEVDDFVFILLCIILRGMASLSKFDAILICIPFITGIRLNTSKQLPVECCPLVK